MRAHGLRGGEVCGVEWPDLALDVAQPVVSVRQACVLVGREVVTGETETKESRRVLPLAPETVTALRALKARHVNPFLAVRS